MDLKGLKFDDQGLIPAVVQDWRDGSVLMLGFMSRDAVQKTLESKRVHFWSRSRQELWEKGETSGHTLHVKDLFLDCDGDTVLVKAEPAGPTCHTGAPSCFFSRLDSDGLTDTMSSESKGESSSASPPRSKNVEPIQWLTRMYPSYCKAGPIGF